jgi:hypothetical protein
VALADVQRFLDGQRVTRQFGREAVLTLDAFPRTSSGKIQKFQLRSAVSDYFTGDRSPRSWASSTSR